MIRALIFPILILSSIMWQMVKDGQYWQVAGVLCLFGGGLGMVCCYWVECQGKKKNKNNVSNLKK